MHVVKGALAKAGMWVAYVEHN